ncbi:MAG: Serine protease AprX [Bacteroidetes bacterium ADurb.Bin408]|nr:MAG: Serine protease AprX [Bacteroidetes bacterium ADurb.Bin408]
MAPVPDEELLKKQLTRMQGQQFADNNINGKGVRIAVFDAGFPGVDKHEAFKHLRDGKKILKTWDFVKNREFVYAYSSHGTSTLSCITGIYKGIPIGLATESEFLLARTEMSNREPLSEEENWLAAAEWADKNGADIISSSLGYTYHRYFTKDMDGKKSLVTRAANMAASKGMLVINSAGNEGNTKWKFIGAPADADSVLSIGGIAPESNYRISFSSYGPTADKRMKPNVCAFGTAFVAGKVGFTTASGTSFSCPLISGFAACAWQTHRNLTNMELFKEIEKSGDLYPYFDYAHGFGVPQADYFIKCNTKSEISNIPPFTYEVKDGFLEVSITGFPEEDTLNVITDEKEVLLYYNIQKPDNSLRFYYVIAVYSKKPLQIDLSKVPKGDKINLFYKRHLETYQN